MNISLEINLIKQELEDIADENLIATIKSILKFARNKNHQTELPKFTIEEYISRAQQSELDIKTGSVKDFQTLEKESDNW